jgi:4-hydroxybenzoate polyprenyltransferase
MISSILLYIAGIVFNDYFDIEIDLKERPLRKNFEAKNSDNCHSFVGG